MAGKRKTAEIVSGASTIVGAIFVVSTAFWEHRKAKIEARAANEQLSPSHASPTAKTHSNQSHKHSPQRPITDSRPSTAIRFPHGSIKARTNNDTTAAYMILDKVAVAVEGRKVTLLQFANNWAEMSIVGSFEVGVQNRRNDVRQVRVKVVSPLRLRSSKRVPIVVQPGQQRLVGFGPSFGKTQKVRIEIE
ncbi:MAG: hypothetical protein ACFCD0_09620 [Gemmataceae bacterium]